ncbi:MAG: hypothetical protein M3Y76_00860, partial [Chloroflexota bacterium]|nr:hypothetical protein [Chloroflexota bacterium]
RETHPQPIFSDLVHTAATASEGVQVLQQVKIEALDITVIKGSGQAVLNWAASNGFTLDRDTHSSNISASRRFQPLPQSPLVY